MTSTLGKVVMLYDPAVSSLNLGDQIISDSCDRELAPILRDAFVVRVSTHLPVSRYLTYLQEEPLYRFVCGSNLLRGKMNARFRQWDLTPRYARLIGPAVLIGAGWWQYGDEPNAYTRWLYGQVLDPKRLHSVRDELTASYMRSMGFDNVVNTACPTMWRLTEDHCRSIPPGLGHEVVTTITDYAQDQARDRAMLLTLAKIYDRVGIWIQGTGDLAYIRGLDLPDSTNWHVITPDLASYDLALESEGVDYVGTRLHAGIRALQHRRRSLIIGVDNRSAEKQRDFNISYLHRDNIADLASVLRAPIVNRIRIPEANISRWREQFPELRTEAY